jgi:NAD(P)-dependent dehydrogenase (short-subunit alcohol dehydrogenase family)
MLRESSGKLIILSSLADSEVTRIGWSSYSSAKAALTRFITILGLEEDKAKVYGIYPGLTRTSMVDDLISGKFKGKMSDEDVTWFIEQDKQDLIEPPEWTANAVSKLVVGKVEGEHGKTVVYSDLDPDYRDYDA